MVVRNNKYLIEARILKGVRKWVSRRFCIKIKSPGILELSRIFLLLKSKQIISNAAAAVDST